MVTALRGKEYDGFVPDVPDNRQQVPPQSQYLLFGFATPFSVAVVILRLQILAHASSLISNGTHSLTIVVGVCGRPCARRAPPS